MSSKRIVYFTVAGPELTGGQKMIFEHVKTLNAAGFSAVVRFGNAGGAPEWFDAACPFDTNAGFSSSEYIVMPDDVGAVLGRVFDQGGRFWIFCQNSLKTRLWEYSTDRLSQFGVYIACSPYISKMISRYVPGATVSVIRAFADERLFSPAEKTPVIVTSPRKRAYEAAYISRHYASVHSSPLPIVTLGGRPPAEFAKALGEAAVFLCLSRLEGLGMTPMEAMLSGCLVTGFAGGPAAADYATPETGLWAAEEDLDGAVEQLCRATDLVQSDSPAFRAMRSAGAAAAAAYSYRAFQQELIAFWSRTAPDARA